MTEGDLRPNSYIGESVGHPTSVECVLKLRTHESVSFARVTEDEEVKAKHRHVEDEGDQDKAQRTGDEMSEEQFGWDSEVAEEIPELLESAQPNGSDGEEADPLAAHDSAEGQSGHGKPNPPGLGKRLVVILVTESGPGESGKGGEEDERGVEEDVAGLSDHAVFEGDEKGGEKGGGDTTVKCA